MKKVTVSEMENAKLTIKLTREGLSSISRLIRNSKHLSLLLDGGSHFTENCEWSFDEVNNRQAYYLHLPTDKLEILEFLFRSILEHPSGSEWSWSDRRLRDKMLKRILKAIQKFNKEGKKNIQTIKMMVNNIVSEIKRIDDIQVPTLDRLIEINEKNNEKKGAEHFYQMCLQEISVRNRLVKTLHEFIRDSKCDKISSYIKKCLMSVNYYDENEINQAKYSYTHLLPIPCAKK